MSEWATQWQLQPSQEVEAKPLLAILTRDEIGAARLMKVDVEGAEWQVISEMASWLGQTSEEFEVIVEVSRSILEAQGKRLEELLLLFGEFGFQGYRIENDYLTTTCISRDAHRPPKRIVRWPEERVDQIDLTFSRVRAEDL